MEKNLETQDDYSFTTQILRKGALDNDIPDPLVLLLVLRFPATFWMSKRVTFMAPADWIWIPLKEKKNAQNYIIQASQYLFLK